MVQQIRVEMRPQRTFNTCFVVFIVVFYGVFGYFLCYKDAPTHPVVIFLFFFSIHLYPVMSIFHCFSGRLVSVQYCIAFGCLYNCFQAIDFPFYSIGIAYRYG